ncbi:hypothetical protein D9757_011527 [Collybiopsis confluens]|uniref:Uncharacterized protein n=1 Tax=Collybiopsis confluens TaxID=2823264 RepID=A0A8H5H750_9AGAR|nr:hypothetical protein D9757_011527 [Collybiopsis confluens]
MPVHATALLHHLISQSSKIKSYGTAPVDLPAIENDEYGWLTDSETRSMAVSSSLFVHVFVHFVIHNAPPSSPRISRNASFTPPRMSILDPTLVAISVLAAGVPTGV